MKKLSIFLLTFTLLFSGVLAAPNVHAQTKFKDVNDGYWAAKEIEFLTGKEIIQGYKDGTFRPNASITRLQSVLMMLREKGIKDYSNVPDPGFADVKPGQPGYKEISKAVQLGIISGKTNEKGQKVFDPNGILTRAQMAKILSLAYNLKGNDTIDFADVPKTYWAYPYIQGLASNQVTFGYGNGKFGVNDLLTRAQFSVMMARVLDESFRTPPSQPTGKVYPDGWVAPVLKSKWSPNSADNFKVLENELGFTDGGHFYNIEGAPHAIVVNGAGGSHEVDMKFYMWDGDAGGYLKQAYRIPIVARELFKLYFDKDADRVWNYFNRNDIPEKFTANGRTVKASFIEVDGSLYLEVGYPNKPF